MSLPTIFQFGTSRFLQAHVDLFASEAMEAGQTVPSIVVVQTTRDPERAKRVAAFGSRDGFPVHIRGLGPKGDVLDKVVTVRSVVAGIAAAVDWPLLVERFVRDAAYVFSNTADRGYDVDALDRTPALLTSSEAPVSFPAMLLALLHARWQAGGAPVTVLPCELLRRNGEALRLIVGRLATGIGAEPAFCDWLDNRCLWINTLVDRIVSEPIDPIGAVAEPYALWALERRPGLVLPFTHPDVIVTEDLEQHERLKLHILNLGHSWLAQRWLDAGSPDGLTVGEALADPATRSDLMRVYRDEVIPGFAVHGLGADAAAYADRTLTRFENPFLKHRLADIAANHHAKLEKRVGDFLSWVAGACGDGRATAMPRLATLMRHAREVEA